MYAFVSVSDYQIVGVAETIEGARENYLKMLNASGQVPDVPPDETLQEQTGQVEAIATAVVDGNTLYYIKIGETIYTASVKINDFLPFLAVGDTVTVKAGEDRVVVSLTIVLS